MSEGLIYKKMGLILADTDAITKDRKNQQQGFLFRGIDDIANALHPVFARHGVFITTEVIDHESAERQTKNGGSLTHRLAKIRFRFYAEDGSNIESVVVGEAMDSGDKSMNKCLSIALKYALLQTLLIPTEDGDPDETAHEVAPRQRQPESRSVRVTSSSISDDDLDAAQEKHKSAISEVRAFLETPARIEAFLDLVRAKTPGVKKLEQVPLGALAFALSNKEKTLQKINEKFAAIAGEDTVEEF